MGLYELWLAVVDLDPGPGTPPTPPVSLTVRQSFGLIIEHIIPLAAGGSSELDNLWLACDLCNSCKGARTHAIDPLTGQTAALFHPRQ